MDFCQYKRMEGVQEFQCGNLASSGSALCYAHQPAKIAERRRAKALAKAAPALLAGAEEAVAPWGGTPTDGSEPAWVTHLKAAIAAAEKEA